MKLLKVLILITVLLLPGCWLWDNDDYNFDFETIITDYPANLSGLNTQYDDYNSALPNDYQGRTIYFSSNSPTFGVSYNIVRKYLDITVHPRKNNIINISYPATDAGTSYDRKVCLLANTAFNELGPYIYSATGGWKYFLYANDESGNLDIRFIYDLESDWNYNGTEKLYGPAEAKILNSPFDDAYPSFNDAGDRIYFCSNRENNQFDIYSIGVETGFKLHEFLTSAKTGISKETVLSGNSNDKCPFINRNLLVFTSDRAGGYGGYDLYYSVYADGTWSEPLNFGNKINTENDEYRPITFRLAALKDDLMVFSSNRPEGKGGYDLYCVNIGDLIENESWQ